MLGSGALVVIAEGRNLLDLALNVARFLRNEPCGRCVPCRLGSEKMVNVPEAARGGGDAGHVAMIRELAEAMAAASICGRGQAALVDVAPWDDFEWWYAGGEWGSGKADS